MNIISLITIIQLLLVLLLLLLLIIMIITIMTILIPVTIVIIMIMMKLLIAIMCIIIIIVVITARRALVPRAPCGRGVAPDAQIGHSQDVLNFWGSTRQADDFLEWWVSAREGKYLTFSPRDSQSGGYLLATWVGRRIGVIVMLSSYLPVPIRSNSVIL